MNDEWLFCTLTAHESQYMLFLCDSITIYWLNFQCFFQVSKAACANVLQQSIRYSSYYSSPLVDGVDKSTLPNVKIDRNPDEWKYVEQILAPLTVPQPTAKSEYPSGWKPQTIDPNSTPYFIKRNKNHMIPIYVKIQFRGTRRRTHIRHIQGDIWALEADIRRFLEDYMKKKMSIRVNEFSGEIRVSGDYVNLLQHFLGEKGF